MADFTYLFADAVTNQINGALPLTQVSFSSTLNSAGSFSGTLNMKDPRVRKALTNSGLLQPGRTAIYVDYGGILLWGGLYLSDNYDNSAAQLTIQGQDFWSGLADRKIAQALSYNNVDQLTVAADLVNKLQAAAGSLGIAVPSVTSGENVTVAYDPNQLTTLSSAFQALAQQSGTLGFDYMVDVGYSSVGAPVRSLTLSYPRRGRIAGDTGLVFDVNNKWAGPVKWSRDATASGNTIYGIGAGVGPSAAGGGNSPLRSTQSWPALIDAGWPLREQTLQRSDVTSQAMLDSLTASALFALAVPVVIPQTTHGLDMEAPEFGSWLVGDDARLILDPDSQDLWPSGSDSYWRIVGQQVNVADEGQSTVQLTWNAPPVFL